MQGKNFTQNNIFPKLTIVVLMTSQKQYYSNFSAESLYIK